MGLNSCTLKTTTLQINQSVQKIHQIYNEIYEGKVEVKKQQWKHFKGFWEI
jgi:hypothetical protein